jgi:beta-galactosidase
MRTIFPFNHDWLYYADDVGHHTPDSAFEQVILPHTNKVMPLANFDTNAYCFISTYRKRFTLPQAPNGRRVYLDFDGAMIAAIVRINDHEFAEHRGGYVPFSYDITDYLQDGENVLEVRLDSTERKDIPPFGYTVDYLTFGGIYREVNLRYVAPAHIRHIFAHAADALTAPKLIVQATMTNPAPNAVSTPLTLQIAELDVHETQQITIPPQGEHTFLFVVDLPRTTQLWSLEHPKLYTLSVATDADTVTERFGVREAQFAEGTFMLNGQRLKLRGVNRHQTYPYIGAAAAARLQRHDAEILKYELGVNIVRTSHYPQSRHFLDRCDELGVLVFEEIPGWQHIGDADWQNLALRDVQVMIQRDRNHPSIILWGVRINESADHHDFYTRTNMLARQLDPTRATTGVRNFLTSEFLEDVFSFNDFSNTVQSPTQQPHLVSEYSGHMFPTKPFDQEERRVEHALRHARIQNLAGGRRDVLGAIAWCMFDYNTHRELGSGNRICYHGVMDMFRLPKYAAHFYASQQAPAQRVVLQAATGWTMGDRNADGVDPLVVFSNCQAVDLWFGERYHGRFYPDRNQYPYLPHPPFTIPALTEPTLWGDNFNDLRIVGYINGQAVAEQRMQAGAIPQQLIVEAAHPQLHADGQDMTRIRFAIADKYGNPLPYANVVLSFTLEGEAAADAVLYGDNPFALIGGQAALYLRAGTRAGQITVRAQTLGAFAFAAAATVQVGS